VELIRLISLDSHTYVGGRNYANAIDIASKYTSIQVTTSLTLFAEYSCQINLTYNVNGGVGEITSGSTNIYKYPSGSSIITTNGSIQITLDVPTKDGKMFSGWGDSSTSTDPTYFANLTYSFTASKTIYALWADTSFVLNFYSTTTDSYYTRYYIAFGNNYSLPASPQKSGYRFVGWATSSNYTDVVWSGGTQVSVNNINYYAVWGKTYTMTYYWLDSNGNSSSRSSVQNEYYRYDTTTTTYEFVIDEVPNKTFTSDLTYSFIGFSNYYYYSTPSYANENDISSLNHTINVTDYSNLYAIYNAPILVTYNANGATVSDLPSPSTIYKYKIASPNSIVNIDANEVIKQGPTETGFDFVGWSENSGATTASYMPNDNVKINKPTILYAIWAIKSFTITYYSTSDDAYLVKTYTYGTLYTQPSSPNNQNYYFIGWSDSGDNTVEWNSGTKTCLSDSVWYAVWERNFSLTHKFMNAPGGLDSVLDSFTVNLAYNSKYESYEFTIRAVPSKVVKLHADFTFLGYTDNLNSTTPIYANSTDIEGLQTTITISHNTSLYAIYSGNIVVSYDLNGGKRNDS
jgi:uncharacterized repeat protein (TIGR02543 family)